MPAQYETDLCRKPIALRDVIGQLAPRSICHGC
jgi:hypothetical protein